MAAVTAQKSARPSQRALRFLFETQAAYFAEMLDYLRANGVRAPLAGSNSGACLGGHQVRSEAEPRE
jgi:hypothetical protein